MQFTTMHTCFMSLLTLLESSSSSHHPHPCPTPDPLPYFKTYLLISKLSSRIISKTSLAVQWLRIQAFTAEHTSSIRERGAKIAHAAWWSHH